MKKYNTTTNITDFYVDWMKIKGACMTTVSKQAGKEPSDEWKRKILICEHSPIRRSLISWKWEEIPYAISTHFVRHHIGVEKFVGTERADRTDVKDRSERSQMNPVPMEMDANIQGLKNICSKRLCMSADPTTREYCNSLVDEIYKYDENVAWSLVPQCVRCGGCVEPFSECQFYKNLMKGHSLEEQQDVMSRYDIYAEYRKKLNSNKTFEEVK